MAICVDCATLLPSLLMWESSVFPIIVSEGDANGSLLIFLSSQSIPRDPKLIGHGFSLNATFGSRSGRDQ